MNKKIFSHLLKGGGFLLLATVLSGCKDMIILNSKGPIGQSATQLIYISIALMLIVVVPVFVMVIWFSVRYREGNKKATYKPDWAHSNAIEWVIWMIHVAIIAVLAYLTWKSTHELDPYKPIASATEPLEVDVISTDWNWVFVYPEDSVATVNELVIETGRPVKFRLTSATVMTSFFIPQLGSQMYAMAGMQTQLNLRADHSGEYFGRNLEFSGDGYDNMHFKVKAISTGEFHKWVQEAKQSKLTLSMDKFNEICVPNMGYPVTVYTTNVPDLLDKVMAPYMDWMNMDGSCGEENCEHECCKDKNNNN